LQLVKCPSDVLLKSRWVPRGVNFGNLDGRPSSTLFLGSSVGMAKRYCSWANLINSIEIVLSSLFIEC
jgi:hypothetical protein